MLPKKYALPLLLMLFLMLQLIFTPQLVLAANETISLEQAVQIVKEAFPVPKNLTQLTSSFNQDYTGRSSYSLSWNSKEEPYGSMHAQVDAQTGEIISMDRWENSMKPNQVKIPLISRTEAKEVAFETVKKLTKKDLTELKFIDNQTDLMSFNMYESYRYNFRWIRLVNGIPYPTNSISVSVQGDNGQVVNFYQNWSHDVEFPAATEVISLKQAQEVFKNTPMLELQYFKRYPRNPLEESSIPITLVYQLKNEYYGGAIDALTGKALSQNDFVDEQEPVEAATAATAVTAITATTTTVATTAMTALEKSSVAEEAVLQPNLDPNLEVKVSKDEAEAIVEKFVDIPSSLKLRGINLNPNWRDNTKKIWDLAWSAEPPGEDGYQFMNAQIDADTGELISFWLDKPYRQGTPDMDRKEALILAQDFLEKVSPSKVNELKLNNNYYFPKTETIVSFTYTRLVNGIPFPYNSINIGVDTLNKQIISFSSDWSSGNFPSPSQAISIDKASDFFLQNRPLELNYTQIYKPDGSFETRLVYQPSVPLLYPGTQMINALTGESLDYEGRTEDEWPKPFKFNDIEGNEFQKEIETLGQIGAFGDFGESFIPEEKVKTSTLLQAMLIAKYGVWEKISLSNEEVIKEAIAEGWINGDLNPSANLSRLELSKIMIRLVGMDAAAQVQGIYHLSFRDIDSVPAGSIGYLALSWGLDLIKGEGYYLRAGDGATREEAAYALVQALKVKQQ